MSLRNLFSKVGRFNQIIERLSITDNAYDKRQTAKMKLSPSVFSSLSSRIKVFVFVFAVSSKRHYFIFV